MGIKTIKRLNLKHLPKDIDKAFSKKLKVDFADEIIKEIVQGKSPVRKHKFKEYKNMNYKGRKAPVDMLLSGEMLESIAVDVTSRGSVEVSFDDEKAVYHQKGEGNLPVRKLLPQGKSKFNVKLTKFINKVLKSAIKKAIKKQ